MGAKTWMLVLADSDAREALAAKPALDRSATQKLAHALFPGEKLAPIGDGDLFYTSPPGDELHIGCSPRCEAEQDGTNETQESTFAPAHAGSGGRLFHGGSTKQGEALPS